MSTNSSQETDLAGRYLAGRSGKLGTEGAFEVLRKARLLEAQGRSVVHGLSP